MRKHTDLRPGAPVPPGFGGIWPSLDGRCLSSPEVDFHLVMGAGNGVQVTPHGQPGSIVVACTLRDNDCDPDGDAVSVSSVQTPSRDAQLNANLSLNPCVILM